MEDTSLKTLFPIMHQWSLWEFQGVSSTQRGACTPRNAQDRASVQARREFFCLPRGAPLWAWLLLGALLVPGARSFLNEQEELLVELHNYYRGQVSPNASAMLPLKWDSSLKVIAEGYAAKCIWNHNPDLEDTGENLFAGTGTLDLRLALEKWFLERLDYDYHNNSCDEDKMCGHYTQMVWADTHRVGCAFHICNTMVGLDWEKVSFLVCNYFPAGNYEGERPYVEGDWCSKCPEKLQECENNLCVADVEDEEDEDEEDPHTVVPPFATPDSFLYIEGKEEVMEVGGVPPPSVTSDPSIHHDDDEEEEGKGDVAPLLTPDSSLQLDTIPTPAPPQPKVPSTKQGQEEEEKNEEGEETFEKKKEKEEKKKDLARKAQWNIRVASSTVSLFSPSMLLICVTVLLCVRL